MKTLFAMDLIDGECVRLVKGDFSKVTVYSKNPVDKIEELVQRGARDFHIIDPVSYTHLTLPTIYSV